MKSWLGAFKIWSYLLKKSLIENFIFLCSVKDVLHNRITDKFERNAIEIEFVFKVKFQNVALKVG